MYIGRREDGTIYGAWATKQPDDEFHTGIEEVYNDHPDYVAFRDRKKNRVKVDPVETLTDEISSLKLRIDELEKNKHVK